MNILFVCTANTCRSAMGEAILKSMVKEKNLGDGEIVIQSAGVYAMPGQPANLNAIETVKDYGANLDDHRASLLTTEMIEQADLILTMTANHKKYVLALAPTATDKVFTLKQYSKEDDDCSDLHMDILDPYGADLESYKNCAKEIAVELESILRKIF